MQSTRAAESSGQTAIGLTLAGAIIGSWLALHIHTVFFHQLSGLGLLVSPAIIVMLCWLNVGLFILAHDAMHGSLAPGRPRTNLWLGRLALGLYAAFPFDRLKDMHVAHHRDPGTDNDPDFNAADPRSFWPWYRTFMRHYFGIRELLILCIPVAAYLLIGARIANLLLFWALPALLSSLQLFYFGTYLPHRHSDVPFADRHHARTNQLGWLASLISCFHFGYHHEHHLSPGTPWWRLPSARQARRTARLDLPPA